MSRFLILSVLVSQHHLYMFPRLSTCWVDTSPSPTPSSTPTWLYWEGGTGGCLTFEATNHNHLIPPVLTSGSPIRPNSTDAATVVLHDVNFYGNAARSAGCAYMFSSSLEYINGELLGNEGNDDDGGGLYLVASTFVLTDLLFQDNWSSDDGGAIRILLTRGGAQQVCVTH